MRFKIVKENHFSGEDLLLREKIRRWRLSEARAVDRKAFQIFSDKTLDDLIRKKPENVKELLTVVGIGPFKAEKYGTAILRMVNPRSNIDYAVQVVVHFHFPRHVVKEVPIVKEVPFSKEESHLWEQIRRWRLSAAQAINQPAYIIFDNKTLEDIVRKKPANVQELLSVVGIGPFKAEKYGSAILRLVNRRPHGNLESQSSSGPEHLSRAYEPWSTDEESLLESLQASGKSQEEMAKHLRRTKEAIKRRLEKIKVRRYDQLLQHMHHSVEHAQGQTQELYARRTSVPAYGGVYTQEEMVLGRTRFTPYKQDWDRLERKKRKKKKQKKRERYVYDNRFTKDEVKRRKHKKVKRDLQKKGVIGNEPEKLKKKKKKKKNKKQMKKTSDIDAKQTTATS